MFQSIFQGILNGLPPDPNGVIITTIVAVGIGIGALTALLGALHSRPTISMMMFVLGITVGYMLPAWLSWNVSPSITIAMGGVVFGVLGFVLHRWCVAFALGTLVAAVAMIILFDQTNTSNSLLPEQTTVQASVGVQQIVHDQWVTASPTFRKLAPWVALGAFVASAALAFGLPKFGMAALYSLGGTLLTLFSIGLGHSTDKITWLDSLKSGPMTVAALGITMLLVGFLAQVGLVYRPAPRQADADETKRRVPELD